MSERQLIFELIRRVGQLEGRASGGGGSGPSGFTTNLVQVVDSIAAIRALPNPIGIVWVKEGSPYGWDAASTDTDDGISVVKLDSTETGRYHQLSI